MLQGWQCRGSGGCLMEPLCSMPWCILLSLACPTTHPLTSPYQADKHLELIARLMAWFNAVLDAYRRAKAWVMSQGGLAVAVLVLLMAVLLRWLGWI